MKFEKVEILKHCRVDGKPVKPGEIVETSPHRAKALIDNAYAAPAPTQEQAETPESPETDPESPDETA